MPAGGGERTEAWPSPTDARPVEEPEFPAFLGEREPPSPPAHAPEDASERQTAAYAERFGHGDEAVPRHPEPETRLESGDVHGAFSRAAQETATEEPSPYRPEKEPIRAAVPAASVAPPVELERMMEPRPAGGPELLREPKPRIEQEPPIERERQVEHASPAPHAPEPEMPDGRGVEPVTAAADSPAAQPANDAEPPKDEPKRRGWWQRLTEQG